MDNGKNIIALEGIFFHLTQALRLFDVLDLSGFGPLEQSKWNEIMNTCKNGLESGKDSVNKLNTLSLSTQTQRPRGKEYE